MDASKDVSLVRMSGVWILLEHVCVFIEKRIIMKQTTNYVIYDSDTY